MKFLLVAVLVTLFAAAHVSCEENDPKEDTDYWTSTNQIQVFIQPYSVSLITGGKKHLVLVSFYGRKQCIYCILKGRKFV